MANVIAVCFALLTTATLISAMALPYDGSEHDFKELVYDTIQELISEGRVNPQTSAADREDVSMPQKRRRQGFCYRRARYGKKIITIPYVCWH